MRRSGFTLVELVLVAAILAVLTAIAIPRYSSSLSSFRVRTAARRLAADLAMAQAQARAASASRQIEFRTAGYTIHGIGGLDGKAAYVVKLSEDPYRASLKADLADNATILIFDGYGAPDRGGTIHIGSGDHQRAVAIDPTTGVATVQ